MKNFDTCIFDFDLTLADSSEAILICFKHTLSQFGFELPDDRTIYNTIGLPFEKAFTVLAGVTDAEMIKVMKECYVSKADEVMSDKTYFYNGAAESLLKLKKHGLKTGIVSTKFRRRIKETFERQNKPLLAVDMIIGGEDVPAFKPAPDGLNAIIERLGADKSGTLYIGDSYIDAETAANAGVMFGAVTTGSTTKEDFLKYQPFVISGNVTELIEKLFAEKMLILSKK